ncbi:hypothetical protein [Methylocapsa acidiphila]|uniref:hypothetical protein n=1 Tax=Methylocapsa acidiphila TaxID=133552 RepID=UPI0003FAFA7D|nr:hypothetical protein [Methylocapsa acidiphila]
MTKGFWIGFIFLAALGATKAQAQTGGFDRNGMPPASTETGLLNEKYLTPTGETVPHPGESQSGGVTPLERSLDNQNNKIDDSICSNCGRTAK